jgi:hypothetical protein
MTRHEPDWKKEWKQHRREATTVRLVKCSEKKEKRRPSEREKERRVTQRDGVCVEW